MTDADLPSILEVYRQCEDFLALGPVSRASMEMVRSDIEHSRESNGVFCTVRGIDGTVIGILDFFPKTDSNASFLSLVMISRPYRNRGIGTLIVPALEAYLRKTYGTIRIDSGVQYNNPAGIRFWKKRGFILDGEAIERGDGTTAFQMHKSIDASRTDGPERLGIDLGSA